MHQLQQQFHDFMDKVTAKAQTVGLDLTQFVIDHACYRSNTDTDYAKTKADRRSLCNAFIDHTYRNREFVIAILKEPLTYQGLEVLTLEIPSPKPGKNYPTGFEHIEILTKKPRDQLITNQIAFEQAFTGQSKGSAHPEGYLRRPADNISIRCKSVPLAATVFRDDPHSTVLLNP